MFFAALTSCISLFETCVSIACDGVGFKRRASVVITGVALYASFAKIGLNNSIPGLVLAHSLLAIPMVFLTMSTAFARFDRTWSLPPCRWDRPR